MAVSGGLVLKYDTVLETISSLIPGGLSSNIDMSVWGQTPNVYIAYSDRNASQFSGMTGSKVKDYMTRNSSLSFGSSIVRVLSSHLLFGILNGRIDQWTTSDVFVRSLVGHSGTVTDMIMPSSPNMYSCSIDRKIIRWDLTTGAQTLVHTASQSIHSMTPSAINGWIYFGMQGGWMGRFILATSQVDSGFQFQAHTSTVLTMHAHAGLGLVITADQSGVIKIWNTQTRTSLATLTYHRLDVRALALTSNTLYSGSYDGAVNVFDLSVFPVQPSESAAITMSITATALFSRSSSLPVTSRSTFTTTRSKSISSALLTTAASLKGSTDNAALSGNMETLIIVSAIGVALAISSAAILISYRYTRTNRVPTTTFKSVESSRTDKNGHTKSTKPLSIYSVSVDTGSEPVTQTSSTVTEKTLMDKVTTHELSIPAFLLMKWGLDFIQGDMIAKGGGGVVYRCSALRNSLLQRTGYQPLVVKVVADTFGKLDERNKAAFYQELAIMWKMRDHPNFVKVYGYDLEPTCLVMKFYGYGDLDSFIDGMANVCLSFTYSKRQILSLYTQCCAGIGSLHAGGIIHCDIKPANVLLDVDARTGQLMVAIADFGISRVISNASLGVQAFVVSDLRGASVPYAAPDVLFRFRSRREELDTQVWQAGDIYALSMTLLELLSRKSPWS